MVVLHKMDEIDGNKYLETGNVIKCLCEHCDSEARDDDLHVHPDQRILGACDTSIGEMMIGE
jgi:hypothetical protein